MRLVPPDFTRCFRFEKIISSEHAKASCAHNLLNVNLYGKKSHSLDRAANTAPYTFQALACRLAADKTSRKQQEILVLTRAACTFYKRLLKLDVNGCCRNSVSFGECFCMVPGPYCPLIAEWENEELNFRVDHRYVVWQLLSHYSHPFKLHWTPSGVGSLHKNTPSYQWFNTHGPEPAFCFI